MSFTHNGVQHRRSTETEDKKLATRIFDKLKSEIAEGRHYGLNVERVVFEDLKTDLSINCQPNEFIGGSAWESNPPGTVSAPHTGFEVREPHQ